jgi:hypothetical protein
VHFRLVAYFGDGGSGGVKSYRPDEIDTGAFILGGPRPHDAKLERGLAMGVATWRRIADDVVPAPVAPTNATVSSSASRRVVIDVASSCAPVFAPGITAKASIGALTYRHYPERSSCRDHPHGAGNSSSVRPVIR